MDDEINKKYDGKYIYKITNIINNKCYIGQTRDYKARFQGHKLQLRKNIHDNPYLQYAWNKYGENAFTFEVLEYAEDYNERERYYIKLYNSTDAKYGYNILEGGENPPVRAHSMLSFDDVKEIQNMFLAGASLDEICLKFPLVTRGQIGKINSGKVWYDDSLVYPLKKDNDNEIGVDVANLVINDLLNTSLTQKEIANKYNISRTCVTAINNGNVQKYYNELYTYPLRKSTYYIEVCDDLELFDKIIYDIQHTDLSLKNIQKKYGIGNTIMKHINRGEGKYFRDGIEYPMRKPLDN